MSNTKNKMRKSEYMGTCQVCFSVQKLPDGRLSLHGYERPGDGRLYADCEGSHHLPYEESCEVTKSVLQSYFTAKKILTENLEKYKSFPDTVIYEICRYHGNNVREYEEVEVGKDRKRSFSYKDKTGKINMIPSYEDALKQKISEIEREMRYVEGRISFLQRKIDEWKLSDLIPVSEEKPKYLIQFRFTGNTYTDYYKSTQTITRPINVWFDKKITDEDGVKQSIQTLYKEYKYENLAGIFEARSVMLPEKHKLKKYMVSDYQVP